MEFGQLWDLGVQVLSDVNYLAALLATVACFVVGMIWYSPKTFLPYWMTQNNVTYEAKMAKAMITGVIINFVVAVYIGALFVLVNGQILDVNWLLGLGWGVELAIFFMALPTLGHYMYEGKPLKLWAITAGYNILLWAVTGAIMGAML